MRFPWLDRLYKFFSHDVGIDLGTANTLVYVKGHGIVIVEPSIVAINTKTGRLVAIGADAKQMVGRTPAHLEIIRPLVDGVISNFEVTEEILAYFLRRVARLEPRKFFRPQVVIGVPSGITNVEARAVRDATRQAGARAVQVVEEPMAAAIGIRLPVREPVGNLIVDIGGGTADIAVISLGGIVRSKNLRLAGDRLNRDIIAYVRDEFKILLGEKTAEEVKIAIGSVWKQPAPLEATIRGRDLVTGLPKEAIITDADIKEAIGSSVGSLVDAIKEVLESTPPEVVSDIMHQGIILVGGGALLAGIRELLTHELKIPVIIADDPLTAVVRGTGIILENLEAHRDILLPDEDELPR
ncbi:MAG: rod shape-determining protein [Candidatus Vogelbacteria bacterium]|nr:rod shape-determining protein [Candidatus Vogelbacteria bacterium]